MANLENLKQYKNIHMIGIGGVSMSGLAAILNYWGFHVTGSDTSDSDYVKKLRKQNIEIYIGHNPQLVKQADLVVYSAAIKKTDPELATALELNIPTMERADLLGKLTEAFKDTIAISGTHGKTTTTSMISVCFLKALLDPNIQVGAILKEIDGNYKLGKSDYFIIEACEYVESFLKFKPKAEIILNIDNDHLDYFKTFDNIKNAFIKYVKLLPENGLLVVNADDKNCLELQKFIKPTCNFVTYGIDNQNADFIAKNITFDNNGFPSFDVYYKNKYLGKLKLSVPGRHNVLNALAATALCTNYLIDFKFIQEALSTFTGANRRLEYKGSFNNISIYDDYAHHPTEIKAVSNAIHNKTYNETWVVFQPHTYSRTKNLLNDFADSLLQFNHVIVTKIYAAREVNTDNITSQVIVDKLAEKGKKSIYIEDFDDIVKYLKSHAKPNDIILTLGAGTITNLGPMLLK